MICQVLQFFPAKKCVKGVNLESLIAFHSEFLNLEARLLMGRGYNVCSLCDQPFASKSKQYEDTL